VTKNKTRILIADNSLSIQKLVHLTFAEKEFEVVTASDGSDALTKARTLLPAFILADCYLDIIDGPSLVNEVRREKKLEGCQVVLLKMETDSSKDAEIREAKPAAILTKPFDAKGLLKIISDLEEEVGSINAEEVTVTLRQSVELDDEKTTTLVEPTLKQKRLEEIAAAVAQDTIAQDAVDGSEDPTPVVPISQMKTRQVSAAVEAPAAVDYSHIAETEIRKWIENHLPAIAERLIKDEISRKLE
jgi:DNA-binding response OmpR family regulator